MRNSADLAESLVNLHEWKNSKPTANPGRRSTILTISGWSLSTPTFAQPSENSY